MKAVRIAATALTTLALVATTSAAATATPNLPKPGRWSPWTPVAKNAPFVAKGYCSVAVKIEEHVQDEVQRTRTVPGGTEIEVKGRYVIRLTPFNGSHQHYDFVVSGASLGTHTQIAYNNGDFLFRATGANFFGFTKSERKAGLPPIAIAHGPIALLYVDDSKSQQPTRVDVIEAPDHIVNACQVMGVNP